MFCDWIPDSDAAGASGSLWARVLGAFTSSVAGCVYGFASFLASADNFWTLQDTICINNLVENYPKFFFWASAEPSE